MSEIEQMLEVCGVLADLQKVDPSCWISTACFLIRVAGSLLFDIL